MPLLDDALLPPEHAAAERAHEASALILDGGELAVAEVHARRPPARESPPGLAGAAGGCVSQSDIDGTPPPSPPPTPYVGASKGDALRSVAIGGRGGGENGVASSHELGTFVPAEAATAAVASGASTSNTDWSAYIA